MISLVLWTWSYVRPYRARLAILSLVSALQIALGVLAPWPLKLVVDNVLGGQPMPGVLEQVRATLAGGSDQTLLVFVVVAGLMLQFASVAISTVNTQLQVDTGQRMVYALRERLLAHLQALSLRHHVVARMADSVYRLEGDAYSVNNLAMGSFGLFVSLLTLAAMFLVLLRLDWSLAILSLGVVPFLYASLRYYSPKLMRRAQEVKEFESRLVGRAYETLSNIKVVKSFARESHELTRFHEYGEQTRLARLQLTWQESVFGAGIVAVTVVGNAVILVVGALHVLRGELTVGALLVVIAYLAAVYGPLSSIARSTGALQDAVASSVRVREIFAMLPERLEPVDGLDASNISGEVRFEHVCFHYDPERPILSDISFIVRPGETLAFVGMTGAGKSTAVSLIPRFYEPSAGRVLIDGIDVARYSLRSLRDRIAIVPQDPVLFGETIADNLRYGRLDASEQEIEDAARAAQAHDFIVRLPAGYATRLSEAGSSLSGGERQRLSIARALLKNAPILILDEPTSSLDAISESAVFDALKHLRQGRTTIVIAHRLSTIRSAERILVLHDGRIAAHGTHSELLVTSDLYRRMCERLGLTALHDEN